MVIEHNDDHSHECEKKVVPGLGIGAYPALLQHLCQTFSVLPGKLIKQLEPFMRRNAVFDPMAHNDHVVLR